MTQVQTREVTNVARGADFGIAEERVVEPREPERGSRLGPRLPGAGPDVATRNASGDFPRPPARCSGRSVPWGEEFLPLRSEACAAGRRALSTPLDRLNAVSSRARSVLGDIGFPVASS